MNQGTCSPAAVADTPMKRRRGRPRKDESLLQGDNAPMMPGYDSQKKNKQTVVTTGGVGCDMVGQVVSGVIEGAFDAGYLLKVKVGDTDTHLRGVVFLPGRFTPITAANDVAPLAKMYKRTEMPMPLSFPPPPLPPCVPPLENSEKQPVEQKIAPLVHDQGLTSKFQPTVPIAVAKHFAPKLPSLTDNLGLSSTLPSLEGKSMSQQLSGSGLMSQSATAVAQALCDKITKQDDLMQEFEASMTKGPIVNVEATDLSKSTFSAPSVDVLPGTESLKHDLQIQNQGTGHDLKPNSLVHELVKISTPERNQSPIVSEPGTISSEPIAVNLWMEKQASSQDAETSAFAMDILSGDDTSHVNGRPMSHAATITEAPANPVPTTSLPALTFGRDTDPSSLKLPTEVCPLQRMIDHQSSGSSVAADIMKQNPGPFPMTYLPTSLFEREAVPSESKIPDGSVLPTMTKSLFCSSSGTATNVDCNIKDTIPSMES